MISNCTNITIDTIILKESMVVLFAWAVKDLLKNYN